MKSNATEDQNEAAELNSSAKNQDERYAHHASRKQKPHALQLMQSKQPRHQQYNETWECYDERKMTGHKRADMHVKCAD